MCQLALRRGNFQLTPSFLCRISPLWGYQNDKIGEAKFTAGDRVNSEIWQFAHASSMPSVLNSTRSRLSDQLSLPLSLSPSRSVFAALLSAMPSSHHSSCVCRGPFCLRSLCLLLASVRAPHLSPHLLMPGFSPMCSSRKKRPECLCGILLLPTVSISYQ